MSLSEIMWHDAHTQERFDALHKKLPRAKQMRDLFVCLAQQEPSSDSSSSSPAPAAAGSSSPAPAGSSSPAPPPPPQASDGDLDAGPLYIVARETLL